MLHRSPVSIVLGALLATTAMTLATPGFAFDADAARAMARRNFCFKCHGILKSKDGPSYSKVAEKYRGKANAEARIMEHLTSGENAKFPDGEVDAHKIIKTHPPNDTAQIKNLIQWILAQ
jgi:cytochrome c